MQRTRRIFTHGWIGASALNLFTGGYYPATSAFDDTAVVHGSVFGPQASGIITGASATGSIDAPVGYGEIVGPQAGGAIEGPGETWH